MKRFKQVKTKLLLFLISGILLLSIGFVGCGTGPQTKTTVPDRGAYAVDFSAAPSELGFIDLSKSIDSMAGLTGFTIEAWVKRNTSGDLSGGIFSRSTGSESEGSYDGISLYIASDTPSTPRFKMSNGGTISVTALAALDNGEWTHIAGVFHSATAVHDTTSCASPHLDIYINGDFKDCANAISPAAFSYSERIGRSHSELDSNTIEANTKLNAIIDEVRFWKVARTESQIETWMNKEIDETNWNQADPNNELIGYWKLNEGAGSTIVDSSGTGNGGFKNYCNTDCGSGGNSILWDDGWVAGKSF